jgi:biotin synthase
MIELIDTLAKNKVLTKEQFTQLIANRTDQLSEYLFEKARKVREIHYGKDVYLRGLIEFTNHCKNDCYYCGIRKSNLQVERYRLTKEQIIECCDTGYALDYRTFVLQGGEDSYFTKEIMVDIIQSIKQKYPDCALTLSLGEKSYDTYLAYYQAGADRYLLRQETANATHYRQLHPEKLSAEKRKQCLSDLKAIGFQVGTGFMVGSPFQTPENLAEDMLYIYELQPHMVGIGPFIPHHQTPFADKESGSMELTLFMLGLLRLMLPHALLPSTTALGTINPKGREKGLLAGANIIMPNLSPIDVRSKYLLYDNKICISDDARHCRHCLERRVESAGYKIVSARGDCKNGE